MARSTLSIALGCIGFTVLLAVFGLVGWFVPATYAVMSVIAFVAYGSDKAAAQSGRWRTSEATLIGIGLLGGWPGALVAMEYFRHKTRKQPFRGVFFASVAANIALLAWIAVAPYTTSALA